jgi:hypothetical protein
MQKLSMGDPNPPGWETRPARVQIDADLVHGPNKIQHAQMGSTYNIWYHKWSRDDKVQLSRERPATRVHIAADAGMTMGMKPGSGTQFTCVFFARGNCPHGYQCKFWHRLPLRSDRYPGIYDIFGRNLFGQLREDLGGAGTFMKDHRTLFVGRISYDAPNVQDIVRRHFGEFGHVEKVKVLDGRGIAFVTFSNAYEAQFAKEAMSNQQLDHDEMLNVRWAGDDPNPRVVEEEKARAEEEARQAMEDRLLPPEMLQFAKEEVQEEEDARLQLEAFGQEEEGGEEVVHVAKRQKREEPVPDKPVATGGFLNAAVLDNLKALATTLPSGVTLQTEQKPALQLVAMYDSD